MVAKFNRPRFLDVHQKISRPRLAIIASVLAVVGITTVILAHAATDCANTAPCAASGTTLASTGWTLKFDDEFNGTSLDRTKWDPNWYGEGGSMNGVGTYSANTTVSNGNAVLTLASSGSGALIHTNYTSGRYALPVGSYAEARVLFAGSASSCNNWAAWWASGPSWPAAGEHDIAEVLSGQLTVNYHSSSGPHNQGAIAGSWCGAYHTYGVWRKAGSAEVYWDGVKVKSYTTDDNGAGEELILNVGKGSSYGTSGQMLVDWVRAWAPSGGTPVPPSTVTSTPTPTPSTITPSPTPLGTPVSGTTSLNDATTGTGLNQFNFSGTWATSTATGPYLGDNHYSNTTGSYYQVQFSGTQAKVYTEKNINMGIVGVSIDGGTETMVDAYASGRQDQQLVYTSPALTNATHTLKVRITGTKNAASIDTYATADRVDIVSGSGTTVTPSPAPSPTPLPVNTTTSADLNHDGIVNVFDLSIMLAHWGFVTSTPVPTSPTPSPTPTPAPISSTVTINDATTGTGLNQFNYTGTWAINTALTGPYLGDNHHSYYLGDYYQVQFSGTQAKIYSEKNTAIGIAGVSIDGGTETMVDSYIVGGAGPG